MPTFNQLVRKGRQDYNQEVYSTCTSEELQLFTEKNFPICLLHRREVYVLLLRLLHLRSLTQLLERSPEFVFQMESK